MSAVRIVHCKINTVFSNYPGAFATGIDHPAIRYSFLETYKGRRTYRNLAGIGDGKCLIGGFLSGRRNEISNNRNGYRGGDYGSDSGNNIG